LTGPVRLRLLEGGTVMAYRQPVPSWRQGKAPKEEAKSAPAIQEEAPDESELDHPEAMPIAQAEHHAIGREFILAGRAIFTVAGEHARFTFQVQRQESKDPVKYPAPTFFISVLTGQHYSYMGIVNVRDGGIKFTKGSKIKPSDPAARAALWTLARVWVGKPLPAPAAIYHEGRCGRCGRPLTVPESILTGFGPECAGLMGVPYRPNRRGNHEDQSE
jgi:hypothetical protein